MEQLLRLTTTKQDILSILKFRPGEEFFVNELIRLTGRFPNSVEQALKGLEKDKLVLVRIVNNKKFYLLDFRNESRIGNQVPEQNKFDWIKLLNREASYAFNPILCNSNIEDLEKVYGVKAPTFWYNDLTRGVYYLKSEMAAVGEAIWKKLDKDKSFAKKDAALCRNRCNELVALSKQISEKEVTKLTNKELKVLLAKFATIYQAVFPFLMTPHAIERYFEGKIRDKVHDDEALKILLSPVSTEDDERNSALRLASYSKNHGRDEHFEQLLSLHWQSFCWLSLWSVNEAPLTRDHFREEINNILKKVALPQRESQRLQVEGKRQRARFEETLAEIKTSRALRDQIELLQEYIFLRTYRKNAICQAHFYHLPLLFEIASRLGLNQQDVRLLSYDELIKGLGGDLSVDKLQKLAKDMAKGWAILMWQGKITTITGAGKIVQAMEQYGIVSVSPSLISEKVLKGNTACRGKVVGKVKVIHELSEINKVQAGDILVARMTTPDYMVAVNKCVGIITDEGGITCHAAIVSREFGIPCLIATHNATKLLKDNDLVQLDATNGIARVIEKTQINSAVKVIKGKPIFAGKIKGRVVIVNSASELDKARAGDILVTSQPTPDFLSTLYRIKGMIIDEDSLTSHGALYANSLQIPTIVGTGSARDILSDGELVELDAGKGIVRRLQTRR